MLNENKTATSKNQNATDSELLMNMNALIGKITQLCKLLNKAMDGGHSCKKKHQFCRVLPDTDKQPTQSVSTRDSIHLSPGEMEY